MLKLRDGSKVCLPDMCMKRLKRDKDHELPIHDVLKGPSFSGHTVDFSMPLNHGP